MMLSSSAMEYVRPWRGYSSVTETDVQPALAFDGLAGRY